MEQIKNIKLHIVTDIKCFELTHYKNGENIGQETSQVSVKRSGHPRIHYQSTQKNPWHAIQEESSQSHSGDQEICRIHDGYSRRSHRCVIEQVGLVARCPKCPSKSSNQTGSTS